LKKHFLRTLAVVVLLLIVSACPSPVSNQPVNQTIILTVTTTPDTGLRVKIDNVEYISPKSLQVTAGSHTIEVITPQEKDNSTHVSGNDTRYIFDRWNDNNTENPRTVNVTGDITYTAQMKVQYKVEFEVEGSGTVSGASEGYYDSESTVTITASPDSGYILDHWEVNGVDFGNSNPLQLTVNEPKHVKAVFVVSTMTVSEKYQININSITGPIYSSPAMGPDGAIYIGAQGGYAVILPADYSYYLSVSSIFPVWSSPVVDYQSNTVYFVDNGGYLHIYYPDMTYTTSFEISNYSIYAAPVIKDNYIYVVDLSGNVIRVDIYNPSSYTVICSLNEEVRSSPVVVYDMIFIATSNGYIYAMDPSGYIVWQKQLSDTFFGGFAVDKYGNLYIAGEKLWCIDPWNGNTKWSYELSGQAYGSPVISESGVVYIGDISGTLHAVDSLSGNLIWSEEGLGSILSTCVIGDNNIIYVAAGTCVFALSSNGDIMSYIELENFIESSPLLHFGKLFVADEAGYFYVINALSYSIQDPNESWPMFQKNWYHTAIR
jgi:outer membrane protein assembly factor BamB